MRTQRRLAFTLFQLLTVLAILAIGFSLFLPALAKARAAAARSQSANNLKQIGLACHSYYDSNDVFPPGCDANHFSTATYLLPYVGQFNLYSNIDLQKPVDDKINADARRVRIRTFLSPLDPVTQVKPDCGATNYLFNAGSKADLKDGDGVFFLDSKVRFPDLYDHGTSLTLLAVETLKGGGKDKAEDVRRQYVLLSKDALKGLKDDAGVAPFEEKQNREADRCASWMDGRFLQGTFNTRLGVNDARPDVSCGGAGGAASVRSLQDGVLAACCDASVRYVKNTVGLRTWRAASSRNGEEPGPDW